MLSALYAGEHLTGFHLVTNEGLDADDASGDSRGEDGAFGRNLFNAANGKDGGLKFLLLGNDGFNAQILHGGFVERDTVGYAFGIESGLLSEKNGGKKRRSESEEEEVFHGWKNQGLAMAVSKRTRAR